MSLFCVLSWIKKLSLQSCGSCVAGLERCMQNKVLRDQLRSCWTWSRDASRYAGARNSLPAWTNKHTSLASSIHRDAQLMKSSHRALWIRHCLSSTTFGVSTSRHSDWNSDWRQWCPWSSCGATKSAPFRSLLYSVRKLLSSHNCFNLPGRDACKKKSVKGRDKYNITLQVEKIILRKVCGWNKPWTFC